jgi:transcriptional regulator with XRE-family HTH domain
MPVTYAVVSTRLLSEVRRRLRRNDGLTQTALARKAGVSLSHLHNVLTGRRELTPTIGDKLLGAMHLSLSALIHAEADQGELAHYPNLESITGIRDESARLLWPKPEAKTA